MEAKEFLSYAGGDRDFVRWLQRVDRVISHYCGLGVFDLSDQPYRDWFDSGLEPREAAEEALQDEGFPFDCAD